LVGTGCSGTHELQRTRPFDDLLGASERRLGHCNAEKTAPGYGAVALA